MKLHRYSHVLIIESKKDIDDMLNGTIIKGCRVQFILAPSELRKYFNDIGFFKKIIEPTLMKDWIISYY